jgi:hypothetical protein
MGRKNCLKELNALMMKMKTVSNSIFQISTMSILIKMSRLLDLKEAIKLVTSLSKVVMVKL